MKYNGYDIYGERLRVGYCSVHPHIAQDYPCPECSNESDDRQAQYDAAYTEYCKEEYERYVKEITAEGEKPHD